MLVLGEIPGSEEGNRSTMSLLDDLEKVDTFASGCIFLELLACIRKEQLPSEGNPEDLSVPRELLAEPTGNGGQKDQEQDMFCKSILPLTALAQGIIYSDTDDCSTCLLRLASRMISTDPRMRPDIFEVVTEVAAVGPQYFCELCWEE